MAYLTSEEQEQLGRLAPRLREMCDELAALGVSHALVHGDLHPGNVAVQDGNHLFFDWTDACIAHPFFDLVTLKGDAEELLEGAGSWARVRDAYLSLWTDYAPLETLQQVWKVAEPLGYLHQAVSYQHIVAVLEDASKHELASGLPYWLRKLIAVMA
jgi:aminoglycoside phosphotransferase (APT) family kinase protein